MKRFPIRINNTILDTEFGANDQDWSWQPGGQLRLPAGNASVVLHDLIGFNGRCDAIFLCLDSTVPPNGADQVSRAWRRQLRGLPDHPFDGGTFDVAAVGGGITGAAAALTAARLGERVALIQDRPFLGGNASVEIGLRPRGVNGPVVDEVDQRKADGDLVAKRLLDNEPTATVFIEHTVFEAKTKDSSVAAVYARDARTNLELDWVAYVAAQEEVRRYKGDHILTETDIRTHKPFPDAVVKNGGAFCLHYPGNADYDFRLKYWEWDERDGEDYDNPFRSLYSANINNLMMAGNNMSATHVASSST
ncbi:hypothetical protein diail_10276 [Diaporthe ilicicola]|nr:hypothetical protein diail_10276 [Diaporthe ilicicola]